MAGRYHAGELIAGKYELLRERATGGMGSVWVAKNRVLDSELAIKLLAGQSPHSANTAAQRLLEEARAAARLGHPAIVRVHDFGETHHGDPFLAMELLEGEDLADVLGREGSLDPVFAVGLLLPIAHALSVAHERNIVHRDVKPENIFLAQNEVSLTPKLLDFGIARVTDPQIGSAPETAVVGTPDYMSPEQARGLPQGPPTDIWSFCVVLYEAVSGACPFEREDYPALLRAIVEDWPMPLPNLDPALGQIIARGLEKNPERRWKSMRELGDALASWLMERGVNEDITGTSLRQSWLREPHETGPGGFPGGSGAYATPAVGRISDPGLAPARVSLTSEPQLSVIAELNRGGDPVELVLRAERRRALQLLAAMAVVVVSSVLLILMGTGILVF